MTADSKPGSVPQMECCPACGSTRVEYLHPIPSEGPWLICPSCKWTGDYMDLVTRGLR